MLANEVISQRRIEMGMSDTDVSNKVGLSIHQYDDIEQHPDELFQLVELCKVKRICEVLNIDLAELIGIKCDFCEEDMSFTEEFSLPRNELIANRRREMGISMEEFGERVGFYEAEIELLEKSPDHLETWPIDFIKDLAAVIDVPIQILMKVKCNKCEK